MMVEMKWNLSWTCWIYAACAVFMGRKPSVKNGGQYNLSLDVRRKPKKATGERRQMKIGGKKDLNVARK